MLEAKGDSAVAALRELFSGADSGVQNMTVDPHPFQVMRPENVKEFFSFKN